VIRLLKLEYRKQITSSGFWILVVLHGVVIGLAAINFNSLLQNVNVMMNNVPDIDLALRPVLQFPDVWQNITYISGFFKIILALILITSVCNEFTYSTARQNIIDGLSRREWLYSKIGLAIALSFFSTLLVLSVGFVLGFSQEATVEPTAIFGRLDFVLAYFIELLVYFIYALFLALALKRTGLSIILLLAYDFILEPIFSLSIPEYVNEFLPMNTIDNLNQFPFTKYVGNETQSVVSIEQLIWAFAYGTLFAVLSYFIFNKRDL